MNVYNYEVCTYNMYGSTYIVIALLATSSLLLSRYNNLTFLYIWIRLILIPCNMCSILFCFNWELLVFVELWLVVTLVLVTLVCVTVDCPIMHILHQLPPHTQCVWQTHLSCRLPPSVCLFGCKQPPNYSGGISVFVLERYYSSCTYEQNLPW